MSRMMRLGAAQGEAWLRLGCGRGTPPPPCTARCTARAVACAPLPHVLSCCQHSVLPSPLPPLLPLLSPAFTTDAKDQEKLMKEMLTSTQRQVGLESSGS